jgi:hypothetical protein
MTDIMKTEREWFEKAIESATSEWASKIANLGEKFRTETLLPFCKKHKLEYYSGNNDFWFTRESEPNRRLDAIDDSIFWNRINLSSVVSVLDLGTIDPHSHFGFSVASIFKQDYAPQLKMTTQTVTTVDYNDLETFIHDVTGQKYEIVPSEEWENDSQHRKHVDGKLMDHDKKDWESFKKGKASTKCFILQSILDGLCAEGFLPAGDYLVTVSW